MADTDTDSPPALLVTGGAGYIGSHTVRLLADSGFGVVVLDNLVFGHRDAIIHDSVTFVEGDVGDAELLEKIFTGHKIAAVIHFAAFAYVGESVTEPLKYYRNNTAEPLVLLEAMRRHGCDQFIFSSTCATYGVPGSMPMTEDTPQAPINPYGQSKLMLEKILDDCDHAYGIRSVKLRYFNASGSDPEGRIGEDHDPETHLIPLVLMAVNGERENITVFGTDYPTPDGTCIRDYIHVEDLASAHLAAFKHLAGGGESVACNLGTGNGFSVKQIIEVAEEVTGKEVPVVFGDRREGDPPELVADPSRAREVLGWEARYHDPKHHIAHAWRWMQGERGGRYAE